MSTVRVPLRGRDGEPRAFALIDKADSLLVLPHRWKLGSGGYAARNAGPPDKRRTEYLHRVILGSELTEGLEADHINGDRLDNRRQNLRAVTHAQNLQNQQAVPGSKSPFRNVAWDYTRNKWDARVAVAGVVHRLGRFDDDFEAALAAQAFRDEHMPFAQPDPALVAALADREGMAA